uniref:uncharacterized protein LOC123464414 n=1 Tax=Jaculus jaculus TaxID=51337 RepID=UPI001E1B09F0|nr:uncharacterized protein LOC123464414 [Jaculus jaculus]
MGQTVVTPLSLTLDHWKEVRSIASNHSVDVKKGKWQTFCSAEWPTCNVGWPRDGTFNLTTILQVKAKVFDRGPHGQPDYVPYIVTWESLAVDPPLWVAPFIPPQPAPLLPLPAPTSSSCCPVDTKKQPLKPVLPPDPNTPLIDLLSEGPPPYGSQTQAPAAPPQPPLRPPLALPSPVAGRLRSHREQPPQGETSQAFPLRQGPGDQIQYWPFSASDLYNWRTHNPPFSKDPTTLTNLIESILVTHQPTWDDCQQLLQALLTSEEKQRVFLEARKNVPGDDGRPTQILDEINDTFPLTRPEWDHTSADGRGHLRLYRQLLIAGLRGAGRHPTNLAKVKQVLQKPDESPAAFLERIKEAYRMYTPYDPEDPDQGVNVSMTFIWQSAPDIRNKLQRLDNLQGQTLQDLLKEAERIFNKRETAEEGEDRLRREAEDREDKLRKEAEERENARERPNPVLPDQKPIPRPPSPLVDIPKPTNIVIASSPPATAPPRPSSLHQGTGDCLFNLIKGAYSSLNASDSDCAKDCWLCLTSNPPYYEG